MLEEEAGSQLELGPSPNTSKLMPITRAVPNAEDGEAIRSFSASTRVPQTNDVYRAIYPIRAVGQGH